MNHTPIHSELIKILKKEVHSPHLIAVANQLLRLNNMDDVARALTSALINADKQLNRTAEELVKVRQQCGILSL